MSRRGSRGRWLWLAVPGAGLLQITACLGADPQLTIGSTILNALVSNVVGLIFSLVFQSATAAA